MNMRFIRKIHDFFFGFKSDPKSKIEQRLLLKIDWFILSYCCLMVGFFIIVASSPNLRLFTP